MGWGGVDSEHRGRHLHQLGVAPRAARWLHAYIEERGPLLQQWGANHTAKEMARTLHEHSWFQVPGGDRVVASHTGGRQGCKLGSLVFNSAYTPALDMLRWRLRQDGVTLRIPQAPGAFWEPAPADDPRECEIVDAIFVDDEVVILLSESPRALARAINVLLEILIGTFSDFHLEIHCSKGKTEGLIALRGKRSVDVREKWRQADGSLAIPVPTSGPSLHVCEEYKHLGTWVSVYGMSSRSAAHRAQSAMAAYAPISRKVFGSPLMNDKYKVSFLRSLVLSRLTCNLHVCTLPIQTLRRLSGVYVGVLRWTAGEPRFSKAVALTDQEVREKLACGILASWSRTSRPPS
ncbi:unnamed protein product [Prorocentrum cordatum]|uniref:Reverse transcriptase domain-containing protein n=1 Tax=Prorocentrum cordatum TaxID=2364126 RepID=A0ABN9TDI4_9DINO|nr:unnamed protein product [Polarella glacialis]